MKIVQSTWVRFHHIDLARELHRRAFLEQIFTCLPWWRADKEASANNIPRSKIRCNFFLQGIRRVVNRRLSSAWHVHDWLAINEAKRFQHWIARNLPECDALIAISGSGLQAGKAVRSRGGIYVMDRGSTHIRSADRTLRAEAQEWGLQYKNVNEWLIENEEAEADEADLITIPSNFVRDTFINEGVDPSKLRVVPYGVDTSLFYPSGTPPIDRFRLLFVGQFSLRKGVPYLLQAFSKFNHPNKELVVVGSVTSEMRALAARIGDRNVRFEGVVPRDRVRDFMSTSHALVLPSLEEGLALVQAQAMACGCPVIASPNTGSANLFVDGIHGLIVAPRDPGSLLDAFCRLADSTHLRESMSIAGIEKIRSFGGWHTYADEMVRVIENQQKISKAGPI